MCGVVGFWDPKRLLSNEQNMAALQQMTAKLASRGPDAAGHWQDDKANLYLGHRRLSIIDLSSHGAQPMVSASGRFVTSYNGEIYNAEELKKDLIALGASFRGHSDTEVMLAAIEHWGVEAAVKKFNGMFAIAVWDTSTQKIFLLRDRVGKKPLYWGVVGGVLFFGSQLKALKPHPRWQPCVSGLGLRNYLSKNYIVAPNTIFSEVSQVEPGTIVVLDTSYNPKVIKYWDAVAHISKEPRKINLADASKELEELLKDAVVKRMYSDVPLGSFLSGGIDSSLITAIMQEHSKSPVKTFSIGFSEKRFDEAQYAKEIANFLQTEHHEMYVSEQDVATILPQIDDFYDEPFADSSQLPTYFVSKLAREHVTVALSGDGGDELFLGYDRYFLGDKLYKLRSLMPSVMRKGLGWLTAKIPVNSWRTLMKALPQRYQVSQVEDKVYKLGEMLSFPSKRVDFFAGLTNVWGDPDVVINDNYTAKEEDNLDSTSLNELTNFQLMSLLDLKSFLSHGILTKVDRASMACSLEVRAPLLDYRIVEFAFGLPQELKVADGVSKFILRDMLYQRIPEKLLARPKMGFCIPVGDWLRGPLKEWANDLLSQNYVRKIGLLNANEVAKKWGQHLNGRFNWQHQLWGILMLQAWAGNNL